jgi:hypothetical protein
MAAREKEPLNQFHSQKSNNKICILRRFNMNMFNLIPAVAELELGSCGGTCDGCDGCLGCTGEQKPGLPVPIPKQ